MIRVENVSILKNMADKWNTFKKKRNAKEYEHEQGKGFITIQERENMLDKIFNITVYGAEEI